MTSLRRRSNAGEDHDWWGSSAAALAGLACIPCLAIHWVVLVIAGLEAGPRNETCVAPCEQSSFDASVWTVFLLLPELVLAGGTAMSVVRGNVRPFLWSVALAFSALVLVTIALISDVNLRHSLPPGPLFGLDR
jgi:hypothetical protein